MDFQKKKQSSKKIKQSKTQLPADMPLTPLIQQINQLKTELAQIKSKKTIRSVLPSQEQIRVQTKEAIFPIVSPKGTRVSNTSYFKQLKESRELKETKQVKNNKQKNRQTYTQNQQIKQIIFPIRQYELKMNIQLGKLSKIIKQKQPSSIIDQLNKIIRYLNDSIREVQIQNRKTQQIDNLKLNPFSEDIFNVKQQLQLYQQLNNQLQKENIEFKHILAKQVDQIDELQQFNLQIKKQYDILIRTSSTLQDQLLKMKIVVDELRHQRQELEQRIRVYERSIQKKQSQIIMLQEDIRLNRHQSEKHKLQKKQTQKLYDALQKQHKEMKSKHEIELESAIKQKNKWKFECENRRAMQQECLNFQQQRNQYKKQIQSLRKQTNKFNQQIVYIKSKLHQQQKKNMGAQEQIFKITNENDKMSRNLQYYKVQIQQLVKQVEQVKQQASRYKELAIKSKAGIKNLGKARALQEIHQLIKIHKQSQV